MPPRTLYDKLWQAHTVREEDGSTLLYIDCQLAYEVTSPKAFEGLRLAGRAPWRPDSITWPTTTPQSKNLIPSLQICLAGKYARELKICEVAFAINNRLVTRAE